MLYLCLSCFVSDFVCSFISIIFLMFSCYHLHGEIKMSRRLLDQLRAANACSISSTKACCISFGSVFRLSCRLQCYTRFIVLCHVLHTARLPESGTATLQRCRLDFEATERQRDDHVLTATMMNLNLSQSQTYNIIFLDNNNL